MKKIVQYLYNEIYKMLLKEILKDMNIWKDNLCSWIGKLSIVKTVVLPKLIYIFTSISVKLPENFFFFFFRNWQAGSKLDPHPTSKAVPKI